jgi:hypothetical protein
MMVSASARPSRAQRAAITGACACACVFWNGLAHAQSASLESDLFGLTPKSPTSDHPSRESGEHGNARAGDHVQVGALVGVSFPRPLSVEGIVKVERVLAFGAEYSALPQISVSSVQLTCWAVAGSARVFPFGGPFFFGLRAGRQHLAADAPLSAYGYTVPVGLTVDTTFLNPQLGFMWTWDPGIMLGIDVGIQIPLSSQSSSSLGATLPAAAQTYVTPAQQNLESVAKAAGQTTLPTLDLIRIGFLF